MKPENNYSIYHCPDLSETLKGLVTIFK